MQEDKRVMIHCVKCRSKLAYEEPDVNITIKCPNCNTEMTIWENKVDNNG